MRASKLPDKALKIGGGVMVIMNKGRDYYGLKWSVSKYDPYGELAYSHYMSARGVDDLEVIDLPSGYVSDSLAAEVVNWRPEQAVGIFADTGSGKNYFIEHVLLNNAKKQKGRILLLTNRVALGRQTKLRLATYCGKENLLDIYTDSGLDTLTNFGVIEAVSYQQLGEWLHRESDKLESLTNQNFSYVVADEVHFLTSDANFNALTDMTLDFITKEFPNAVRIYMTATPEDIFPIIYEKDCGFVTSNPSAWFDTGSPYRWKVYLFAHDFTRFQIHPYRKKADLIEAIKRTKEEKWMIFVDSVSTGKVFEEMIPDSQLIWAGSKNEGDAGYKEYKKIIDEEKFNVRVLITTSVLENGINIKDPEVRHIAIMAEERCQFMQMLGRVRRIPEIAINVYFPESDEIDIQCRLRQAEQRKDAYLLSRESPTDYFDKYLKKGTETFGDNSGTACTILNSGRFHVNTLTWVKAWRMEIPQLNRLLERIKAGDHHAVTKMKYAWLNHEFDSADYLTEYSKTRGIEELTLFLASYEGNEFKGTTAQKDFSEKFSAMYHCFFGRRKEDKTKNEVYGLNKMNKALDELGMSFSIESKRAVWVVVKHDV